MDIDSSSLLFLVAFLTFLATFLRVIARSKPADSAASLNLPPGPRQLPLIGNLHLLISSRPPHHVLADLAKKHGPVMHLQLGEICTVAISSPEAAKEVLKTHDITFANRPSLLATEILFYNNSDMGFSPYGEYWRQLRKICTIELLSARRVQSFRPLREEEFSNLCKWIASKEGFLINLTERVSMTMCNTVVRASLGSKTDELAKFVCIVKETLELIAGFSIVDFYPSINLFRQFSGLRRRAENLHKILDRILENIINDHKVAANNKCKQEEALANVLLKFNEAGHELYLTVDNIKAVIQDMFNGAIESSSTTVHWAMAEMIRQPRVLEKAQDEVRRVFNDKGFVDESDFDELKYLKLVIKETLRMHPVAPFLLPRQNSERCEILGYEIPANTRVLVNAWAINRDPKYWKEPDSFIPERYLDYPVDYKAANNFEYIPFGGGRRICPGMIFGLANVEVPLAMFLYHFDWMLPDGIKPENLDMTEIYRVTAERKYPLHVIPIVKKPLLQ